MYEIPEDDMAVLNKYNEYIDINYLKSYKKMKDNELNNQKVNEDDNEYKKKNKRNR